MNIRLEWFSSVGWRAEADSPPGMPGEVISIQGCATAWEAIGELCAYVVGWCEPVEDPYVFRQGLLYEGPPRRPTVHWGVVTDIDEDAGTITFDLEGATHDTGSDEAG